jgi:DNA-binding CsgD family transcriptional regulator
LANTLSVHEIYDAAFDDEAFARLSVSVARCFGARSALIHWIHDDGATEILSHSGYFTNEQLALYAREFVAIDPWVQATGAPDLVNEVHNLEQFVPVPQFTASEFYNENIRQMGDDTFRGLGMRLKNAHGSGFITLQRGAGQQPFEEREVRLLTRQFPHLRRMLSIRGKLSTAAQRADMLSRAFDTLGQPVLIVEAGLRLKYLNHAAELMLAAQSVLSLRSGLVTAASAADHRLLQDGVAKALRADGPEASALALNRAGQMLNLTVAPAPASGAAGLALILAETSRAQDSSRAARLRALYGLSPTEASLALLLADGVSPREIADLRHVAVGTVRVQIKSLAAKLGCHRQSDIVRCVARLPVIDG